MATLKIHLEKCHPREGGDPERSAVWVPAFAGMTNYWTYPNDFIESNNMISDTEIKIKGIQILAQHLGDVEAERFIALIQRERFDYTKWRQAMNDSLSVEELSQSAMVLRDKNNWQDG